MSFSAGSQIYPLNCTYFIPGVQDDKNRIVDEYVFEILVYAKE